MKIAHITSLMIAIFVFTACGSKNGDPTPAGPQAPVSNGTGSLGGGGNGIDEKMLESFAISIDTLPEYRRYIDPIIRKIGRGRGDILTTYMKWGVKQKIWYMIPRPLTDLSHEQVGTGFSTDQYALNNDARVYISKSSYLKMDHKERANLLMHEIVMSARLLMKKTPKEQCEKLSGSQVSACSDPDMMKLAEAVDVSEGERGRMDTQDHDAVRAMTIFLMQHSSDISSSTISLKRRELGFVFPWDKAVSALTVNDVRLAIERAKLAGETFVPNASIRAFPQPVDLRCALDTYTYNDDQLNLSITATLANDVADNYDITKVPKEWLPAMVTRTYRRNQNGNYESYSQLIFDSSNFQVVTENFEAHGILDPSNPRRVVDLVRMRPNLQGSDVERAAANQDVFKLKQVEMLITRDEIPQILKMSVRKLAVHFLKSDQDMRVITPEDWEFVVSKKEAFNCTPSMTANAR